MSVSTIASPEVLKNAEAQLQVGEEIELVGRVQGKQEANRPAVIRTEIFIVPHVSAVRGKAVVKVLD
jgi:hypothetical protein